MTQNELSISVQSTFEHVDLTAKSFNVFDLFTAFAPDDDMKSLRKWAIDKGMKDKVFDDAYRYWRVNETLGGYPDTVEQYVALYTAKAAITARFDGLLTVPRSGAIAFNPDAGTLERDLRLLRDKLHLGFRDKPVADALNKWLTSAKEARLQAAFASIVGTETVDADADWLKLSEAIADPEKASAAYVARVLQSAIWQVKRKLADDPAYPVHDHLMPILCGPQGSGKTQATMKFFFPIADLVAPTNFSEITDGRNFELWSFPVLFLDEMEAADRSDVEAIKNAITRPIKSGRALYTNSTSTIRVRSTLWGCTNGTIGDKIADPTGLRRFAPIQVKHAPSDANKADGLPVVDWEAINSLDYLRLWQSVDHRAAHPLRSDPDANAEWARLCEAERQQESVEAWLRQVNRHGLANPLGHGLTTSALYTRDNEGYSDWSKRNGMQPVAIGRFGKRLVTLSSLPWYPFEQSTRANNGIVHVFKEVIRLAA